MMRVPMVRGPRRTPMTPHWLMPRTMLRPMKYCVSQSVSQSTVEKSAASIGRTEFAPGINE